MTGSSSLLGAGTTSFVLMTAVLFGGAAFMTGQALARNWRPVRQLVAYALLLAIGDRFLLFALFGGELLSPSGYAIAAVLLFALALLAYRLTRVERMVTQYPWLYERAGLFRWRDKAEERTPSSGRA